YATITGNQVLTKFGSGSLVLSGNAANTTTSAAQENAGAVVLDKRDVADGGLASAVVIGNNDAGANAAKVVLQNYNQIIDTGAVTVNRSGQLISQVGSGENEVQALTLSGASNGQPLSFSYAGVTTSTPVTITGNASTVTAANVLAALNGI